MVPVNRVEPECCLAHVWCEVIGHALSGAGIEDFDAFEVLFNASDQPTVRPGNAIPGPTRAVDSARELRRNKPAIIWSGIVGDEEILLVLLAARLHGDPNQQFRISR